MTSSSSIFPHNEWKLPLNLAIIVHLLIFGSALFLPSLFKAKPKFADIQTVSIISLPEPAPEASPSAQKAPPKPVAPPEPAKPKPPPPKAKKIAPIEKETPVPAQSDKPAVSLKPLKKKKIKQIPTKTVDNTKQLQDAKKEAEILQEKARLAREALEAEKRLLAQSEEPVPTTAPRFTSTPSTGSARRASSSSTNLIETQYNAAIMSRMLQFWALPDYMQKNSDLRTVAVITLSQDGSVANMFFEQKSGDRVYDQFVYKAISAANPFPPIPPALKKQRYEIGLVFTPGGIE